MFGAQIITSLASFIGIIIFAREIGSYQLGIFFLFQATINVLLLVSDAGLRGALEKRLSEGENASTYLSTMLIMVTMLLFIFSLLIMHLRVEINNYIGAKVATYLVVGLIIDQAYNSALQLIRGELRVGDAANMMAARSSLWLGVGYLSIYIFNMEAMGLIYAYIASGFVVVLYGNYLRKTPVGFPTLEAARSLINYAKFDAISGAGAKIYSWIDIMIIGFFLTQAEVGAYETAWRLTVASVMFGIAIRTAIFPQFSKWSNEGDYKSIEETLTDLITASLFFVIPAFFGVLMLSEELLTHIFGSEFAVASTALMILMIYRISEAINQTLGRTLQAIDYPGLAAYAMIVGVVLNILLNVLLVREFGIIGAAIGTALAYTVMTIIRVMLLNRIITIRVPIKDILWCIFSSQIMVLGIYIFNNTYKIDSVSTLLFVVLFSTMMYLLTTTLSSSIRNKMMVVYDEL